jgi:hypothetical protein
VLLLLLITAMLIPFDAGVEVSIDDAAAVTLVDQYGVEDGLDRHRGRAVVVFVVTAKRLRNIRPWERDLRERFDEAIDYLRITDVPPDSPATYDRIAAKLIDRVPDGVSVLIDLERRWATALDLDTSRPNVLVIDGDGVLVSAHRGRHTPELAAEVIGNLKAILGR